MSEQHAQGADAVVDLNNELKTRREKLANLREQGIAFPNWSGRQSNPPREQSTHPVHRPVGDDIKYMMQIAFRIHAV